MLDVSGCRAKIERAKKHIIDFDRERVAFLDSNPYVVIPKFNEKSNVTESIMGPMPVIPSEFAVIVGDAAQNLRSALDYLAAELARSNGGNPKLVYFPIFETVEKYIAESSGKTKGIADAAKKLMDEIQPYGGGHCAVLWALHSMNNADKHRLLVTISANIAKSAVFKLSPEGNVFSVRFEVPGLKQGDVLGEVSGDSEADHRINFTFDIAFGEPQVIAGESVVPTLIQMVQIVEAIVLAFESRF
jgi:hypothetical protein